MKHLQSLITPELNERLTIFAALLARWNSRINLVSRADAEALWPRHILDSMQLFLLLPAQVGELIDLGSGAGFPGLVLALATGWHAHLVESDHRKAAFLREAVRATGANATVHAVRVETLRLPPATVVTARALAPLETLLPLAAPLLRQGGIALFPKGRSVDAELTVAANEWHMQVEKIPSQSSTSATILRISEIRRAGPTT